MPCRLESLAASDFDRRMPEVKETVVRRIGGQDERCEDVVGVVEFTEQNPLTDTERGQYTEVECLLEVAVDQEATPHDQWVIRGEVYKQQGDSFGKDGGTKTLRMLTRKDLRARQPRTSGR